MYTRLCVWVFICSLCTAPHMKRASERASAHAHRRLMRECHRCTCTNFPLCFWFSLPIVCCWFLFTSFLSCAQIDTEQHYRGRLGEKESERKREIARGTCIFRSKHAKTISPSFVHTHTNSRHSMNVKWCMWNCLFCWCRLHSCCCWCWCRCRCCRALSFIRFSFRWESCFRRNAPQQIIVILLLETFLWLFCMLRTFFSLSLSLFILSSSFPSFRFFVLFLYFLSFSFEHFSKSIVRCVYQSMWIEVCWRVRNSFIRWLIK